MIYSCNRKYNMIVDYNKADIKSLSQIRKLNITKVDNSGKSV